MSNKTRGILCIIGVSISCGMAMLMTILAGLFTVPLMTKFNCDYSSIAVMWTTMSLGALIGFAIMGKLFDTVNPKILYLVGSIAYLFGLSALAYAKTPTAVVILYFFVGFFNAPISTTGLSIMGSKWVGVGRGVIVSIGTVVVAIVTAIFSPLTATCVTNYGLEKTALVGGLILFGVSVILSLVCVCKTPEAYGAQPIDLNFLKRLDTKSEKAIAVNETKMPAKKVLTVPLFWLVFLITFLMAIVQNGFFSNKSGIFDMMGMDLMQNATLNTIFTVATAVIVPVFGLLCDRYGFRKPLLSFAAIGAVLYFCWPLLKNAGYMGGVIICIFANASQINTYMGPNIIVPLFGHGKAGTLIGWTQVGAAAASVVAPVIIALLPSYDSFFLCGGAVFAIAFVISILATGKNAVPSINKIDAKYAEQK